MSNNKEILNQINNLSKEDLELIIKYKSHLFSKEEMDLVKSRYDKLCRETGDISSIITNDLTKELSHNGFNALNNQTNTQILLDIFKCVNFIKNVILAGLVCGGIGLAIIVINLLSN